MADHDEHKHEGEHGRTLAALFQSREEARSAIKPLHKAHFTHTWLGTTSIGERASGESVATVETGGFFAGTESLIDTLVKHGVHGDAARSLEARIEPGNAVLTVDPRDRSAEEASDILVRHGGRVASASAEDRWGAWPAPAGTFADDEEDVAFEETMYARRY